MQVAILTSSIQGTASHHLPYLVNLPNCKVIAVIYAAGSSSKNKRFILKKLRKGLKIGLLGMLNGIRIRSWYGKDLQKYMLIRKIDELCLENNIPFFQTEKINSEQTKEYLRTIRADLVISLGNGYITSSVFSIPPLGMINIHHEVLPYFQNAQSVIWQLYNKSNKTGYTIHQIAKEIDQGDILYQEEIQILFKKTLHLTIVYTMAELYNKSALGLRSLLLDYSTYKNNVTVQSKSSSFTTPSILQFFKIWLNWNKLRKN
jgi:methionyl-tRNA formyltransferase